MWNPIATAARIARKIPAVVGDGRGGTLLLALVFCAGVNVFAADRPSETRPPLPDFAPADPATPGALPPLPIPEAPGTSALTGERRVLVRRYEVVGATVLKPAEVAALTAPYENREISWGDLEALRDKITQAYVQRGYVSSGAVIPDQTIADETVRLQVMEGTLSDIEVKTDGRYRPSVLRARLEQAAQGPVNVDRLENGLQSLQRDPNLRSVNAMLKPSDERGRALLTVDVRERRPWELALDLDNHAVPAVGSERARLSGRAVNLAGMGDALWGLVGVSEGLREGELNYALPLGSGRTSITASGRASRGDIVDPPFDELDVHSTSSTYGLTVTRALVSDVHRGLDLSLTGEVRRSESFLLGSGFSFIEGPEEGVSKITALRAAQQWSLRGSRQVFVARTTFSFGVDALDATHHDDRTVPDGQFVAFLLQTQWARRFPWRDTLLIARLDGHVANDPLLGLEQFAIGGHGSVRGYPENTLVRDQGAIASVEARFPLFRRGTRTVLEGGPFVDGGWGSNRDRDEVGPSSITGVGLTARVFLGPAVRLEVAWAEALDDVPLPVDPNLQERGVYFNLTVRTP